MTPQDEREAIARVIDPNAFAAWQSMYDYCVRMGDDERTARHYSDGAYKPDCDKALAKADAILALRQPGAEYRRAVEDAARVADRHDTGDCTREDMEARRIATAISLLTDTKGENE